MRNHYVMDDNLGSGICIPMSAIRCKIELMAITAWLNAVGTLLKIVVRLENAFNKRASRTCIDLEV